MDVPCLVFGSESSKIIFIFHGNGEDASNYERSSVHFVTLGYQVIVIEYPGYGGNYEKGTISTIVKKYVHRLATELKQKQKQRDLKISIIGVSIGTGPATLFASLLPALSVRYLHLISPYYSISQLAYDNVGWLCYLVADPFPTYTYIKDVKCKVHIYHGSRDQLINISHAKKLHQTAGDQCEMRIFDSDHNTTFNMAMPIMLSCARETKKIIEMLPS
jgi:pimeloyl-ACP methyl ester carboxylesterase